MDSNDLVTSSNASMEFDHTPPHNLAAEQAVLGSMLLSPDAVGEVASLIRGKDFYHPANELIFNAIVQLFESGKPADALTVADRLKRDGNLERAQGVPYLHTLVAGVSSPASAEYYARIVYEQSLLRELVKAGIRVTQLGYTTDGTEVDELVNAAQAEVFSLTENRATDDYEPAKSVVEEMLKSVRDSQQAGDGLTGIPTGFHELDDITSGLQGGQMIIVAARPGMGKALALDTVIPTPTGSTTMGTVKIGDHLLGSDGKPTKVVAATEIMHGRPCYRLYFDLNEQIIADAQHQWQVLDPDTESLKILTTVQIAQLYQQKESYNSTNISINSTDTIETPKVSIILPPESLTHSTIITRIEPVESVPVRCVQVDATDHLYQATKAGIPTHNSTLALDFCRHVSVKKGLTSIFFSLEMSKHELSMRLLSAETDVLLKNLRNGSLTQEDWKKIYDKWDELEAAPLYLDDSPTLSLMEIRSKARRLKHEALKAGQELGLVVLDYIQLLSSGKRVESRQQEVSEFSRALKLLAKELNVPLVAVAQLNRSVEQRAEKTPMLSDLRESGSLEQDADVVILVHREDYYNKPEDGTARGGEADLIVAKHRNGPTGNIEVVFKGQYSKFVDPPKTMPDVMPGY